MRGGTGQPQWAIVLAGGEGRRCRGLTERLYDDARPKQFCVLYGEATLIEQTLRRARLLVPADRTLLSVGERHLRWRGLWAPFGELLVCAEPRDADTGPAVLLACLMIERQTPGAVVTTLPSDHFVSSDAKFGGFVGRAVAWVASHPDEVVLLGARADHPETDYGWLLPELGGPKTEEIPPCRLFEKPSPASAEWLWRSGAYWNTFVMTFRAALMLELARERAPDWLDALSRGLRARRLAAVYERLPRFDLSRDMLQARATGLRVLPMHDLDWSDLGTEDRVRALRATRRGLSRRSERTERDARG